MIDLALNQGDLSIIETNTENGITFYDLEIEDNSISSIIIKALTTPLGFLKTTIIEDLKVRIIDQDKGNNLYELLSAPITLNWSSSIRERIINTIKALRIDTLTVLDIQIQLLDLETCKINLTYSYLGETNNAQVIL